MAGDPPLGEPVGGGLALAPPRRRRAGRFVALEPVDVDRDHAALWRRSHDGSEEAGRLWSYLAYGPFASDAEMQAWLTSIASSEDPLFLTVHDAAGPAGVASFMSIDPQMRHLELGHIWYAPDAQRTEANTEATYLMLREAFDELGYRRVEWKCDALNSRSRAAARRLGFTFEGVFRQHMIVKGRNRDTVWFSMLDREWPAARTAFERWLETPRGERPPLATLRA
jgi:RimJ/RimL family protein N-acetyltransferase